MNRQPTRTDLVEAHEEQIRGMRVKAIDLTTLARAFGSLADAIDAIPPEGALHVTARTEMVRVALERREKCVEAAQKVTAQADALEEQGIVL